MGALRSWAVGSLVSLWQWFFPPKHDLPPAVEAELRGCFPNVDFDRVYVHDGVPLLVRFSWPDAMTLPGLADTSSVHVFMRPGLLDDADCDALRTGAHEFVHVQQYLDYAGGFGLGLFRAFWYVYLVCALRYGYHSNPLEDEAEAFEAAVAERCTSSGDGVGLCCDAPSFTASDVGFAEQVFRSVPGLGVLWRAVEELLDVPTDALRTEESRPVPADRAPALLAGPLLAIGAGALAVIAVGYTAAFVGVTLALTVAALSLWYVAKLSYVAITAAWGVVCLGLVAVDGLLVGVRRVVLG